MGAFGSLGPTAGTAGSVGGGSNPNNQILLTIAVDGKTGEATLQSFIKKLDDLQEATQEAGDAAGKSGDQARIGALGWLKLFAQTELAIHGLELLKQTYNDVYNETVRVAAKTEVLNTTLAITSRNMNYTTGFVRSQVEGIRRMNISHQEAITSTMALMRAQIDLSKATQLARAAQDLAVVSGENSSETMAHLTDAIQTQNVWMLRQYGIVTYLDTALDRYAAILGKTSGALTTQQRSQAVLNLVLTEGQKVTGAYAAAMEDAGKKATSLDRIYKDAAEHIGQVFLPIYTKQIDAMSYLGNVVGSLNPTLMKVMATIALTITTFAALTGVVYALAKAYDALAAAAARAGVTMPAAGALMGLLQKMPGQLALIGLALAGVTAAYALWYKSAGEVRKEMIETRNHTQEQLETINTLQKQMAEMKVLQKTMGDEHGRGATFTAQELALYQNVNEETAKTIILAERRTLLAAQQKQLAADAAKIDVTLINTLKGKAAAGQQLTVNEERLLALKKTTEQTDAAAVKNLEGQREKLQQQRNEQQALLKDTQELVAIYKDYKDSQVDDIRNRGGILKMQEKLNTRVTDLIKDLEKTNAELANMNKELSKAANTADGFQKIPINLGVAADAMTQAWSRTQQAQELATKGIKLNAAELKVVQSGIDAAKQVQIQFNEQIDLANKKRKEGHTPEEQKAFDVQVDAAKKIFQTEVDRQKVLIGSKDPSAQLAGHTNAIRAALPKVVGDLKEMKLEIEGATEATNSLLSLAIDKQERNLALAISYKQAQAMMLGVQQQLNGAQDQSYEVRVKAAELERKSAETQIEAGRQQMAALRGNAAEWEKQQRAAIKATELYEKERLLREKILSLTLLDTSAQQAHLAVVGASVDEQDQLLQISRNQELTEARRIYNDVDYARARMAIWKKYYADLGLLQQGNSEQVRQLQQSMLDMQQSTLEAKQPTGGYTEEQVSDLISISRKRAELEKENYEKGVEYQQMLKLRGQAAIDFLATWKKNKDAQQAQWEKNLLINSNDQRKNMQVERENLMDRAFKKELQFSDAEMDFRRQQRQVIREVDQAIVQGVIHETERAHIINGITAQLEKEKVMRELMAKSDRARQLAETAGPAQKTGMQMRIDMFKQSQAALAGANEQYIKAAENLEVLNQMTEAGVDVTDELAGAQHRLEQATRNLLEAQDRASNNLMSFTEVFQAWLMGVDVDKMTLIATGLSEIAGAAVNAFEAMGRGEGAANAFKQFGISLLKDMAQFALKNAVFYYMKAAADAASVFNAWMVGPDLTAAGYWTAAAAALGIAAGAAQGGGGGGGGGGSNSASLGGGGAQPLKPVETRTNMEDELIKLNENLVVQGRVLQYAGDEIGDLGKNMFAMERAINTVGSTEKEEWDENSVAWAKEFNRAVQSGDLAKFNKISDKLQDWMKYYSTSLPKIMSTTLGEALSTVDKSVKNDNKVLIMLSKRQLEELEKANSKEWQQVLNTQISIDGGGFNDVVDNRFIRSTATHRGQNAIAAAANGAAGNNSNRQNLGRTLSPGGGV